MTVKLAEQPSKTAEESAPSLIRHLDELGLNTVRQYREWCAKNGFSRKLNKSSRSRKRERARRKRNTLNAAKRMPSASSWESLHRERHDIVGQVLTGKIVVQENENRALRQLCQARAEAANSGEDCLKAFVELYRICQSKRARFILSKHPPSHPHEACHFETSLARVARYHRHFVRPVETWNCRTRNAKRQFRSLLDHLLVVHPTPEFLFDVWNRIGESATQKCQALFVHVAAGHSVRKLDLPLDYDRRMSHHFLQAPKSYTISQALRWGEVRGLGGHPALAMFVVRSMLGDRFENGEFWRTVIDWFIKNPSFPATMVGPAIDYLQNQKFGPVRLRLQPAIAAEPEREFRNAQQPNLSMRGRTPAALLTQIDRWHRSLQTYFGSHTSWRPSDIPSFEFAEGNKGQRYWTIRELTSTQALIDEGRTQNHCVATYAATCAKRQTTIWSMRCKTGAAAVRILTIEVRPQGCIVQVRGKNNRLPTEAEKMILRRWAINAGLNSIFD